MRVRLDGRLLIGASLLVIAQAMLSGPLWGAASGDQPRVTVASVMRDLNADGRPDSLTIELVSGRRYVDEERWCGAGEKYEGEFAVVVSLAGGRTVWHDLRELFGWADSPPTTLFFPAKPWSIVLDDYNRDGQVDFNLGQYGSCSGWSYRLLTVSTDGDVSSLGAFRDGWLFLSDQEPSTDRIRTTAEGISHSYYDNSVGHSWEVLCRWDPSRRVCVEKERRRVGP
jgi:hypothetical protein